MKVLKRRRVIAAAGVGLGAGMSYLFDRERGRRRRARARDLVVHGARVTGDAAGKTWRDVRNRTTGLVARVTRAMTGETIPDDVLVARVRAKLGHVVSHPHQIAVGAERGRVTLRGPILASEVDRLREAVAAVRGVSAVDDELVVYESAAGVPELQGGTMRTGETPQFLQTKWAPTSRLLAAVGGAGLALYGMRRRGVTGSVVGLAGGTLAARALTNLEVGDLTGYGGRGIGVQKTLAIQAPVERVYDVWTHPERFPTFMSRVREVRDLAGGRYRWTIAGPAGLALSWTGTITAQVMNRRLEFQSEPDALIRHHGVVRFEPTGDGGTRVDVKMSYRPPGGLLGHVMAKLFGADPWSEMTADLMRMKAFIETGQAPHDAAEGRARGA
jgi:uncharacterized membrane protein